MKNCLIILLLTLLSPKFLLAQIYSGTVIDRDSKEPLVNANVFLAGTLTGTTTNKDGHFTLNATGNTSVPLVVSFVGYVTNVLSFYELTSDSVIKLKKEVLEIDEINVKSDPSGWSRKRMLQVFKDEFLGTSFNAQSCKIENDNDIYLFYNKTTNVLHANSRNPIIIENKLLGYRIYYLLEYFRKSSSGIQFKGYSRFEELDFKNDRQKKNIGLQRRENYLGSIMHFIRFLNDENLSENDTVYDLEVIKQIYTREASGESLDESLNGDLNHTTRISKNEINNIYLRKYENKFQLYNSQNEYLSCKELIIDTLEKRDICFDKTIKIVYLGNLRTSFIVPKSEGMEIFANGELFPKSDCIEIFENGYYNPEQISWFGAMSMQRVGDLLPLEYKYDVSVLKD